MDEILTELVKSSSQVKMTEPQFEPKINHYAN